MKKTAYFEMNPSYILKILFFGNPNQLEVLMIDDTNGNQKKPLS